MPAGMNDANAGRKALVPDVDSITCPVCRRVSHHPDDVREGYCGACHDFTSPPRDVGMTEPTPERRGSLARVTAPAHTFPDGDGITLIDLAYDEAVAQDRDGAATAHVEEYWWWLARQERGGEA